MEYYDIAYWTNPARDFPEASIGYTKSYHKEKIVGVDSFRFIKDNDLRIGVEIHRPDTSQPAKGKRNHKWKIRLNSSERVITFYQIKDKIEKDYHQVEINTDFAILVFHAWSTRFPSIAIQHRQDKT